MAKPIRATPTLNSREAKTIIESMVRIEKSRISKIDKEIAESIRKNSKFFSSC